MKKFITTSLLLICIITLVGCANKEDENTAQYTAVLVEEVKVSNDIVSFKLNDVKADEKVEDPIIFDDMEVVLNATKDSVSDLDKIKELKEGAKITFKVKVPTIVTQSLPPQIPGDTIIKVEAVK